jgi:transaldolase
MAIYLDTSNIEEIKKYTKMGIISGVTTNPTILLKEGVKGGMGGLKGAMQQVLELVAPLPVSLEVTTNDREGMLSQAKELATWERMSSSKSRSTAPRGNWIICPSSTNWKPNTIFASMSRR